MSVRGHLFVKLPIASLSTMVLSHSNYAKLNPLA